MMDISHKQPRHVQKHKRQRKRGHSNIFLRYTQTHTKITRTKKKIKAFPLQSNIQTADAWMWVLEDITGLLCFALSLSIEINCLASRESIADRSNSPTVMSTWTLEIDLLAVTTMSASLRPTVMCPEHRKYATGLLASAHSPSEWICRL